MNYRCHLQLTLGWPFDTLEVPRDFNKVSAQSENFCRIRASGESSSYNRWICKSWWVLVIERIRRFKPGVVHVMTSPLAIGIGESPNTDLVPITMDITSNQLAGTKWLISIIMCNYRRKCNKSEHWSVVTDEVFYAWTHHPQRDMLMMTRRKTKISRSIIFDKYCFS